MGKEYYKNKCAMNDHLLPPIRATDIVESVSKYVDGISQNLQSVSPY